MITDKRIDGGTPFDWGRAAADYARYRDIYPREFYNRILRRGLCTRGQAVLDLGTGTGVLPRNLYHGGANWIGTDISPEQITQARRLAAQAGMDIEFRAAPAEALEFPAHSFDVVTACQCFWYFDHVRLAPKLVQMLKKDGRLLILYMAWLPGKDPIAAASEALVLQYSPRWTGAGEEMHPIPIPEAIRARFALVFHEEYELQVPFTRQSWHGRMRACRGVGASLDGPALAAWDREHRALLQRIAPEQFEVLHYAALAELAVRP